MLERAPSSRRAGGRAPFGFIGSAGVPDSGDRTLFCCFEVATVPCSHAPPRSLCSARRPASRPRPSRHPRKKDNYTLRIATGLGGARSGTHRLDQASARAEMARLFSSTTTPTCRKWRTGTATTFSRSTGRCWIMATPSASTMRQFATLICAWHPDTDELLFEGASRSEHRSGPRRPSNRSSPEEPGRSS